MLHNGLEGFSGHSSTQQVVVNWPLLVTSHWNLEGQARTFSPARAKSKNISPDLIAQSAEQRLLPSIITVWNYPLSTRLLSCNLSDKIHFPEFPTDFIWQLLPAAAKSLQSCPTLCDPMDCSLPGFSVHGILQARKLEWVAISFSTYGSYSTLFIYLFF